MLLIAFALVVCVLFALKMSSKLYKVEYGEIHYENRKSSLAS